MQNLYLIGFMGTGKSTVAKVFQEDYHMKLLEMDEEIVRQEKRPISEIFATDGETYFRDLETELVRKIQAGSKQIVSCGGGAVLRAENVAMMKKSGKVVLLRAKAETILERVKSSSDRPLLNGNMNVEFIAELMTKRDPAYRAAADVTVSIDGKTSDIVAKELVERICQNGGFL